MFCCYSDPAVWSVRPQPTVPRAVASDSASASVGGVPSKCRANSQVLFSDQVHPVVAAMWLNWKMSGWNVAWLAPLLVAAMIIHGKKNHIFSLKYHC